MVEFSGYIRITLYLEFYKQERSDMHVRYLKQETSRFLILCFLDKVNLLIKTYFTKGVKMNCQFLLI